MRVLDIDCKTAAANHVRERSVDMRDKRCAMQALPRLCAQPSLRTCGAKTASVARNVVGKDDAAHGGLARAGLAHQ